jgi:hypothetical protein
MKRWTDREPREYSTLGCVSASASLWIKLCFYSSFSLSERVIEFMSMNARVFWHFFQAIRDIPLFFCQLYLAYNLSRVLVHQRKHT